jgi:hypothetical protein
VNPVRRESRKIRIASAGFLAWLVLGQGTNALGSMSRRNCFAVDRQPADAGGRDRGDDLAGCASAHDIELAPLTRDVC